MKNICMSYVLVIADIDILFYNLRITFLLFCFSIAESYNACHWQRLPTRGTDDSTAPTEYASILFFLGAGY